MIMEKFKIGDRVIGNDKATEKYAVTKKDWAGIVIDVYGNQCDIQGDDGELYTNLYCDCFNVIRSFTKNDLKNGDIVTLKNEDRLIYSNNLFYDISYYHDNVLNDIEDIRDDMICNDLDYRGSDIMKVSRPVEYVDVFSRLKEPKKMTVSEICKELGYDVEIIKEGE